jgi:hypothetical protein
MSPDHTPEDIDWVGAQAKCSAQSMFERLRTRVREDVQKRSSLLDHQDRWRFEFAEEDDEFEVTRLVPDARSGSRVEAAVRFERKGRRIEVHGEDIDVEFVAIVTLDVTGQCRFAVGEAVYVDWEIRRMALEQLFFEEPDDHE